MISSGCINWTILHLNVLDYFAYVFNETNNNQSRRLIHTFSIPGAIFVFPLAYNMLTFMAASILELLTDNLIFLCSLYSPSLSLLYFPGLFTEEIDTSNQTLHRILFLLDNFTRGIVNMGPSNWDLGVTVWRIKSVNAYSFLISKFIVSDFQYQVKIKTLSRNGKEWGLRIPIF